MYFNFMSKNEILYYECLLSAIFTIFIFIFLYHKNKTLEITPFVLSIVLIISCLVFL